MEERQRGKGGRKTNGSTAGMNRKEGRTTDEQSGGQWKDINRKMRTRENRCNCWFVWTSTDSFHRTNHRDKRCRPKLQSVCKSAWFVQWEHKALIITARRLPVLPFLSSLGPERCKCTRRTQDCSLHALGL